MAITVAAITKAGIPVIGHIGLTPQSIVGDGKGYGRTAATAQEVLRDALSIQEAGVFAIVLEAVAGPAAKFITEKLRIPTIGIG